MAFYIDCNQEQGFLQVRLTGDLDINTSPELKKIVLDEYHKEPAHIIFDMEKLDYLDSTGLGALISIYKNAKQGEHTVTVKNARPQIKKLFVITELNHLFLMED
ncbi:MAG: STAS domain-containing protein [Ndongobacter sp.]|nr:STAS domain-containing protein [Ndongobacter sp.]